jgi:hypothetical protein
LIYGSFISFPRAAWECSFGAPRHESMIAVLSRVFPVDTKYLSMGFVLKEAFGKDKEPVSRWASRAS